MSLSVRRRQGQLICRRQIQYDHGAATSGFDVQIAAVILRDAVTHAQPQTRTSAAFLRREEGLEYLIPKSIRNAWAVVFHRQSHSTVLGLRTDVNPAG